MSAEKANPVTDLSILRKTIVAAPTWAAIRLASIAIVKLPAEARTKIDREVAGEIEDAAMALLIPAEKLGAFVLDVEAFYVPAVFERLAFTPRRRDDWVRERQKLRAQLETAADPRSRGSHMLGLLLCEAMLSGIGPALADFFGHLIDYGPQVMMENLPLPTTELARAFQRCGWHGGNVDLLVDSLAASGASPQNPWAIAWKGLIGGIFLLAPDFPDQLMDKIVARVLLPALRVAAEHGQLFSIASEIEKHIYGSYLRRHESEARFSRIYREIGPLLASCGRKFAAARPALAGADVARSGAPRVAFVIQNPTLLAHSATLLTFLRGMQQLARPPLTPVVFFLQDSIAPPSLMPELSRLGVGYFVGENPKHHALIELQEHVQHQRIAAAVFVSTPINLSLAAGMRLAPVVIWWSMKYHRFSLPDIDGYMAAGAFFEDFREIDGRIWRSCRTALPPLTDPTAAVKAAEAKKNLKLDHKTVVLGCIGRDEKLLGEGYLEAVAAVMKACAETVFVWTGLAHVRAGDVHRKLTLLWVAERCRFLGWLPNTKVAAQMIDVYLDSFPFASGHTAFENMAAGVPLVVLATNEALDSSTLTSLVPLLQGRVGTPAEQAEVRSIFTGGGGETLLPFVETVDQYVARSIDLVRDAELRRRVGDAGRQYVDRFARDENGFAASTCRHILDIIAESEAAKSSRQTATV